MISYATAGLPSLREVGNAGKVVISTDDTVVTPEMTTVENVRLPAAWLGLFGSDSATVGTMVGAWLGNCVGRVEGAEVGLWVGNCVGRVEGAEVGSIVGFRVGEGVLDVITRLSIPL